MKIVTESLDITPVIYAIRCKVNKKIYVGKATNYFSRFYFHIRDLDNQKHHCKDLQDDYNAFGKVNFDIVILKEVTPEEDLFLVELEEISKVSPDLLYNSNTKENKVICYHSKTGEILGIYFNISEAARKTKIPFMRIYQSCTEVHQRLENDDKSFILEINQDKIPERLNNIGNGNCFKKGNPYAFKEGNPYVFKKKKITAFNKSGCEVKTYESVTEAAQDLGVPRGSISNCLRGKSKSTGGYTFKYA